MAQTAPITDGDAFLHQMLNNNKQWSSQADPDMLARNGKGQQPHVLWLGCSDSRTPESMLCGTVPGDVFVHRNIANCFHPHDDSAIAVLAYAVDHLHIKRIVVVGHLQCGGVVAGMAMAKASPPEAKSATANGPPDEGATVITRWLSGIRDLAAAQLRANEAQPLDEAVGHRLLVESHCRAQVSNIKNSSVVQKALKEGKDVTVHGWVYDVAAGRLKDLNI